MSHTTTCGVPLEESKEDVERELGGKSRGAALFPGALRPPAPHRSANPATAQGPQLKTVAGRPAARRNAAIASTKLFAAV